MWKIVKALIFAILAVFICGCTRTVVEVEQENDIECETKTVIDLNDRTKTKSYPDNQEGLVMYVSDILGFDLSDSIENISGEIKEPDNQLIASITIKPESKEIVIKRLMAYRNGLEDPDKYRDSETGTFFPPGKDSAEQQELQESLLLGCMKIYYSGVYGETCAYHLYVLDKEEGLKLMLF